MSLSLQVMPSPVALHFQVGDLRLATIRKRLVLQSFDLDSALSGADPVLPTLPPDADGLMLRSLPLAKLPYVQSTARNLLIYVRQTYPRHYALLTGSFDAYFSNFSPKTRSTLKRKVRKFKEMSGGELDFREYRTPTEMEAFHRLARSVSKNTYQERLLGSGLPDNPAYVNDMLTRAAQDRARGYLLFLDDRPVSYLYTPIDDGRVVYAYLGYDPTVSPHSPGTVLQLEAMERLFAEGRYRLFDFTEGDGQHKRQFATHSIDCADLMLLHPSITNRTLITTHRSFNTVVDHVGEITERYGVKTKLKKWLRRT